MTDEYRPVPGAPGYEVSRAGVIRHRRGSVCTVVSNYRGMVKVFVAGKWRTRHVGNVVLQAFVGPGGPGQVARHRDPDIRSDALDNLYWGSRTQKL